MKLHMEFWQELESRKIDIQKNLDRSQKINISFVRIENLFQRKLEEFRQNSPLAFFLYAIYLNNVRNIPH